MFVDKTSVINTWKKFQEKNERTAVVVTEACITILELHIPEEAPVEAKIWKLHAGVHNAKTELEKV